jgi:hypothetical protein
LLTDLGQVEAVGGQAPDRLLEGPEKRLLARVDQLDCALENRRQFHLTVLADTKGKADRALGEDRAKTDPAANESLTVDDNGFAFDVRLHFAHSSPVSMPASGDAGENSQQQRRADP